VGPRPDQGAAYRPGGERPQHHRPIPAAGLFTTLTRSVPGFGAIWGSELTPPRPRFCTP